jgi:hypothetical protein
MIKKPSSSNKKIIQSTKHDDQQQQQQPTSTKKRPRIITTVEPPISSQPTPLTKVGHGLFICLPIMEPSIARPGKLLKRHLFIKPVDGELNTIIVCNLGVGDTEQKMRGLFEKWGKVKSIKISPLASSTSSTMTSSLNDELSRIPGRIGKIIFMDGDSVSSLMTTTMEDLHMYGDNEKNYDDVGIMLTSPTQAKGDDTKNEGLQNWLQQYRENVSNDFDTLLQVADKEIQEFEHEEVRKKKKSQQQQVDEDGFILVTHNNHNKSKQQPQQLLLGTPLKAATSVTTTLNEQEPPFYRFERKKRHKGASSFSAAGERLKQKFEKDKQTMKMMKDATSAAALSSGNR